MKIKNVIGIYSIVVLLTCFGFMFVDAAALGNSTLRGAPGFWYFIPLVPMFIITAFAGLFLVSAIKHKEFYNTYDEIVDIKADYLRKEKILDAKIKALGESEAEKLYSTLSNENPFKKPNKITTTDEQGRRVTKLYNTVKTDLPGLEGKDIIESFPQLVKENSSKPSRKTKK